jgi:hypothetical protein
MIPQLKLGKKAPKSIPQLLKILTTYFNKYIRERDKGNPCICCGKYGELQAGHFYSAGKYSQLRFNEDNVHGQKMSCNYFLSGNLNEYRLNLIERIGKDRVEDLDRISKMRGHRWDRMTLEMKINEYKSKCKAV